MFNWLLSYLVLLTMVSTFSYSVKITGIERTFVGLTPGIIEQGLANEINKENILYFNKRNLETAVKNYLNKSLINYVDAYNISFYYYDADSLSVCTSECDGVQIHLLVDLAPFPNYEQTYNYTLRKAV